MNALLFEVIIALFILSSWWLRVRLGKVGSESKVAAWTMVKRVGLVDGWGVMWEYGGVLQGSSLGAREEQEDG